MGKWPTANSGPVNGGRGIKWSQIDYALQGGWSGMTGGSSLAKLLAARRGKRNPKELPRLAIKQILAWCDAHYKRAGSWPTKKSGLVLVASGERWSAIDAALKDGGRGLPGGSTLVKLLARHRGRRDRNNLPRITVKQILAWADAHHRRTGNWPMVGSGRVGGRPDETWSYINSALHKGSRGLRGRSSLPMLLAKYHHKRHKHRGPHLIEHKILAWADAHRRRTGDWPTRYSGRVMDDHHESWGAINDGLQSGYRGLPGGSSLAKLLAKCRGRRHVRYQPRLTEKQILAWADAHHQRAGRWPMSSVGQVHGVPDEKWSAIAAALQYGRRGLRGGTTLERFLAKHRGRPYQRKGPHLTENQIVKWIKVHRALTGHWPTPKSGPVLGAAEAEGETWSAIDNALRVGLRSLRGETSLLRLLAEQCGVRRPRYQPQLTVKQILRWADTHKTRNGDWPLARSGRVYGASDENWGFIDNALRYGRRSLPGNTSLPELLAKHRGRRHKHQAPHRTVKTILAWADAYYDRTGKWPSTKSGPVAEDPEETWSGIDAALNRGQRGLRGRTTLPLLFVKYRGKRDRLNPPRLTAKQILAWADAFYKRSGDWPSRHSGRLEEDPQETWSAINAALANGTRGLRGRSSLVKLLSKHRKALYRRKGLPLKRSQILDWAAAHHELTGKLPTKKSGPVRDIPGETWAAIDASLRVGSRTLPGRSSLAELLNRHYTPAYQGVGQRLTTEKILKWADDFRRRLGRWPTKKSAYVDPSRGQKWGTIDLALREGHRGLAAGSSLHKLLRENRSNP